jgi:hypothetical protein
LTHDDQSDRGTSSDRTKALAVVSPVCGSVCDVVTHPLAPVSTIASGIGEASVDGQSRTASMLMLPPRRPARRLSTVTGLPLP